MRKCRLCQSEFRSKIKGKRYCSSDCQIQANRQISWKNAKTNPADRLKHLLAGAKNRAKTKELPFDLTHDYLVSLWKEQSGLCCVTNQPFDLSIPDVKSIARYNAPSLDRIDPAKGYTKGNVRFVWYQVNMAIGHYGLNQLLELATLIQQNR